MSSSSAQVVYGTLEELHQKGSAAFLQSIPAYDLYKVAREEELLAYRSLCRVFTMHYGGSEERDAPAPGSLKGGLPKSARRILEDLQESWCIPSHRAEVEHQMAEQDDVVLGIHRSGVLRRREDFFDGVEDVDISSVPSASGAATEDDGGTLHSVKRYRAEYAGTAGGEYPAHAGVSSSLKKKNAITQNIARLRREIQREGVKLLHTTDAILQEESLQFLEAKKIELESIRKELINDEFH